MPLLDNPIVVVLVTIVLLGAVLKWTFRRDVASPLRGSTSRDESHDSKVAAADAAAGATGGSAAQTVVTPPATDDYGLLATVAITNTKEEAERVRSVLRRGGVRATTTVDSEGHHRVLVFPADAPRARRMGNWST